MAIRLVLVGAGQRGMIYAEYARRKGIEIVALAEPDEARREHAREALGVPEARCYTDGLALLSEPRMADAAIIATMDRDHYAQAMAALDAGYHLLLEKPISPVARECVDIARRAGQLGRKVLVCHVLRYAPFFREIKRVLAENRLGRVISIQHNENIGNYHMAHSFVRGNWRREDEASSLILQKSCHDLDLLVWMTESLCDRISSFGSLTYFTAANAPRGATQRCMDCPHQESCRFSAYRCYLPARGGWPANALTLDQSEEGIRRAIAEGPYGRCVYYCDNDVCDHQVTAMTFQNGVTATFNLSAFTNRVSRTMKIMCEDGEIRASETARRIELTRFAANGVERSETLSITPDAPTAGHGGGDSGIMEDFLALLEGREAEAATTIAQSVESHLMACAAEVSRKTGQTVRMEDFRAGV